MRGGGGGFVPARDRSVLLDWQQPNLASCFRVFIHLFIHWTNIYEHLLHARVRIETERISALMVFVSHWINFLRAANAYPQATPCLHVLVFSS